MQSHAVELQQSPALATCDVEGDGDLDAVGDDQSETEAA